MSKKLKLEDLDDKQRHALEQLVSADPNCNRQLVEAMFAHFEADHGHAATCSAAAAAHLEVSLDTTITHVLEGKLASLREGDLEKAVKSLESGISVVGPVQALLASKRRPATNAPSAG